MRKRSIVLLAVLLLLIIGSGIAIGKSVFDIQASNTQEAKEKEEKEKTYIMDLFHDQGHIYMSPLEPKEGEKVTIRLRTERYNVTRAQIQYTTDKGASWDIVNMTFDKQDETGYYDLWVGKIPAEGDIIYYRFIVSNMDLFNTVYYDTTGVAISEGDYSNGWQIVPGHDVPDWAMGALWYSVLPDAFYNGNTTNDKRDSGDNLYVTWNKLRKSLSDKYGGDLEGIERKLDYIDSLYADAIFMNPIHKSYQSAGYGPVRYDEVESSFGNEEDLANLSNAVHEHDMKLMGDVVLTFTQNSSYYFDRFNRWPAVGANESEDSIYNNMFAIYNWPDNYLLTWGSPAIDLNKDISKDILFANENSYLQKYAKIFDGYRFDCGGWLWGTTETDDLDSYTFIKEIRENLKTVNNDIVLLAESDWDNMNTGTWDSSWNIGYMPNLQDYANGLINETLMTKAMHNYEMTIPRNVALSLQNMMCDHDSTRVVQDDDYMYNAAVLIQMTYLGSPSIYYGEETNYIREAENGIGKLSSFYANDWDESNWDYERLNFYKATGQLRSEFSCVKTGVVNMLGSDIEQNTITFGRWDENGAAITVTSQNKDMISVEIPVRKCDIADGTVMTDWYTGAKYVVKDGKITADIIPGGTVIVTGEKSSTYRQVYEMTQIGKTDAENSITTKDATSFAMSGKGQIDGKADTITFANTVVYDGFSVYGNIRGEGSGALMIRNGVSQSEPYYAAIVADGKLTIMARTKIGKASTTLTTQECTSNTYVKLERNGKNEFVAYVATVTDGNLSAWEIVKGSKVSISMDNQVHYGFVPMDKEARINSLTFVGSGEKVTYDTFDNEVTNALFDNINGSFVVHKDGQLTITNTDEQRLNYILTNSMDNDWTFKAKVDYSASEGEYAGVVCQQDEDNYIVVGRTLVDGTPTLFIGKAANGSIAIYGSAKDAASNEPVILQIQRIGGYYSAVYSVDNGENWEYIGRVYTNFSNERVGILVAGNDKASFDWVSFGDSINDDKSTNTPHTPTEVETTYQPNVTSEECKYEWLSGKWEMTTGGWAQTEKKNFSQAAATNKLFYDLYIEATVEVTSGSGWAGLAFGKTTPYTDSKDGYILKYYKNGELVLTYKGKELSSCKLSTKKGNATRLVVDAADGRIVVYAGMDAAPVICLNNTGYYNGYVSFCTEEAKAEFRNFHHGSTDTSWKWISGEGVGMNNSINTSYTSTSTEEVTTIASLTGHAFTNFVCTAKLDVTKKVKDMPTYSGLLLCASEGVASQKDGVFVYVDGEGKLVLSALGTVKASYDLPDVGPADILIVKQNGNYKVFLQGQTEPVLTYSEDFNRGGVLTAHTINGEGSFVKLRIENLQPNQDYKETTVAKKWMEEGSLFSDQFTTRDSLNQYLVYNDNVATFDVSNKVLRCYNSTAWAGGITVMEDTYSDFTMEFKLRIDAKSNGWMSVGMRKYKPNGNHNNSGFSMLVGSDGSVFFLDSTEAKTTDKVQIRNFEIGKWYDFKIVANGKNIDVYVNGVKITSFTDKYFNEGYISFTSGMTEFSVDNLKITSHN